MLEQRRCLFIFFILIRRLTLQNQDKSEMKDEESSSSISTLDSPFTSRRQSMDNAADDADSKPLTNNENYESA